LFDRGLRRQNCSSGINQLQASETTDQATEQWLRLARADINARKYLASHLSGLLELTPRRQPWHNAVRLAGELKLVETVPDLAKWLGVETKTGYLDNKIFWRLEDNSPGRALAQIGDASVPVLKNVLQHGKPLESTRAMAALGAWGNDPSTSSIPKQRWEQHRLDFEVEYANSQNKCDCGVLDCWFWADVFSSKTA